MSKTDSKYKPLEFRIAYCSSEDPDHPISELLTPSSNAKGWECTRFAEYPQIIILEFSGIVILKQIQFLSHQAKIASKIEVFTYSPDGNIPMPNLNDLNNIKFKRIGYLSLDNNERSNFSARELKSVYLDTPAFFLKLHVMKCHLNKYNKFNQVGIIAVNCLGENLTKKINQIPELSLEYDPITADKLKGLMIEKEKAVNMEDYDQASRLKEKIDKLKGFGKQLMSLEERKKEAVSSEDFEEAKKIKFEIEKLRNIALNDNSQDIKELRELKNKLFDPPKQRQLQDYNKPTVEEINNSENNQMNINPANEIESNKNSEVDPFAEKFKDQHPQKSIVIPTLSKESKKAVQMSEYPQENIQNNEESKVNLKAEPLNAANKKIAEPFFEFFDLPLLEMIFSKTWSLRDDALELLKKEILSGNRKYILIENIEQIALNTLGLCGYIVNDNIVQVTIKVIDLINTAISIFPEQFKTDKAHLINTIHSCLQNLLEKLSDNNQKVKQGAEDCIINLSKHTSIGFNLIIFEIIKNNAKKQTIAAKFTQAKLNMLSILVRINSLNPDISKAIIDYAISNVKNSSNEVRSSAFSLLVEVYKHMGKEIMPFLNEMRPAQKDILLTEFKKAGGDDLEEDKKTNTKNSTYTKETKTQDKTKMKQEKNSKNSEELNNIKTCEYCGKFDQNFNQDSLDLHMYKDCPMLYLCKECENIIEVLNINNHLINECANKSRYKECPTCLEAILKSDYSNHIDQGMCNPLDPSKCLRCPLCKEDLPEPTLEAWRDHILISQCDNNERKNF